MPLSHVNVAQSFQLHACTLLCCDLKLLLTLIYVAGIAIEGTVITSRDRANLDFYGRPLTARQLLTGHRKGPTSPFAAAQPLYKALQDLMARVDPPISAAEASRYEVNSSYIVKTISGNMHLHCAYLRYAAMLQSIARA